MIRINKKKFNPNGNNLNEVRVRFQVIEEAGYDTGIALAYRILRKAQDYTPVETGLLRANYSVVDQYREDLKSLTLDIANDTYYAIYVHEDLEKRHNTGGAKFLTRAAIEVGGMSRSVFLKNLRQVGISQRAGRSPLGPTVRAQRFISDRIEFQRKLRKQLLADVKAGGSPIPRNYFINPDFF